MPWKGNLQDLKMRWANDVQGMTWHDTAHVARALERFFPRETQAQILRQFLFLRQEEIKGFKSKGNNSKK